MPFYFLAITVVLTDGYVVAMGNNFFRPSHWLVDVQPYNDVQRTAQV